MLLFTFGIGKAEVGILNVVLLNKVLKLSKVHKD